MTNKKMNNTISVDCVIFGFDFEKLNVLLVDRELKNEAVGGEAFTDLTLTGNHILENESLEDAAARVLFDLTGLENIYLKQFGAFCDPDRLKRPNDQAWLKASGRDPGSRIISVGYYSLLATENVTLKWKGRNVKWYPVSEVKDLAFDHMVIFKSALQALRRELLHEPIGFELLPEKFTLSQLQKLYEVILDVEMDKRNFRKKIARMKYLIALDEKQKGVAHKPARLYTFSREVYEKNRKEVLDFNI